MKQITKLAGLAQTLQEQTTACKRCGICQAACPLFPQTGFEKDIARGKIAVLEGVMSEVVKDAPTNRRITTNTPMEITGPAAGHDLLKTKADPDGKNSFGNW